MMCNRSDTKQKWITDGEGNQKKIEVAKLNKCGQERSIDAQTKFFVRYGHKPLEIIAKGKDTIEFNREADVTGVMHKMRDAVELGELDVLILSSMPSLADALH